VRLTQEALRDAMLASRLTVARDGIEALAMLRKQGHYADAVRPDLILLDLNLPGKNGRIVLAEIKQDPAFRRIPVVIISGSMADEDVSTSYDLHANCYIAKPSELGGFVHVMRTLHEFWVETVKLAPQPDKRTRAMGRELMPIKALLVEDSPADARLIAELLSRADRQIEVRHVSRLDTASEALERETPNVVILDLSLPDSKGLATFRRLRGQAANVPVVVLTGLDDMDLGLQAIAEGASDYLLKDELSGGLLVRALRHGLERKRMEDALRDTHDQLQNQAAELEQVVSERTAHLRQAIGDMEGFSYAIAHDMRAPLRAMQSYAQYLVDEYGDKLDEQGVNYLHQIMRSSVRLDRLTHDVLSYTRIVNGELAMDCVDLDLLVRDLVAVLPFGRRVKPEIRIRGRLPRVVANEALLAQCISNLLDNGAKFVSPGATPHLEISAESIDGAFVRVCVKDDGIGIPAEDHHRVFKLLERIQPAAEYEGTGIGLAIVRKAAERMGASAGFESAPGEGSKFWVQLREWIE
jgi:signal transduction histidine kinase